jgi:hypothetical protein
MEAAFPFRFTASLPIDPSVRRRATTAAVFFRYLAWGIKDHLLNVRSLNISLKEKEKEIVITNPRTKNIVVDQARIHGDSVQG